MSYVKQGTMNSTFILKYSMDRDKWFSFWSHVRNLIFLKIF